jgi:hypothetical protein
MSIVLVFHIACCTNLVVNCYVAFCSLLVQDYAKKLLPNLFVYLAHSDLTLGQSAKKIFRTAFLRVLRPRTKKNAFLIYLAPEA